jgi:hypothetical protein
MVQVPVQIRRLYRPCDPDNDVQSAELITASAEPVPEDSLDSVSFVGPRYSLFSNNES